MHGRQNIEKMQVKRFGSASAANKLFIVTEMGGLTKKMFPPSMPPHVLCGLRGPPSWAWQECNRLLRLGRP
jgi:hypothetical protein